MSEDTPREPADDGPDDGETSGDVTGETTADDGGMTDDDENYWARYGRRRSVEEDAREASPGEREQTTPAERLLQGEGDPTARLYSLGRSELREQYGPLRTLFKRRENRYTSFQRQLNQARIRTAYDQFLATTVVRMLYIVAIGVVLGAIAAGVILAGPSSVGLPGGLGGLGDSESALAVAAFGLFTLTGMLTAGIYWSWHRVLKIRQRIDRRRRDINYNLPYAITFAFALSRAGVGFDRIVERLADSTDTYGAVAEEFDRVVRDVEMFGNNLYTGLENLRAVTPSDELRRVTDDIIVILETGGDLTGYFQDEIETQLETAVDEQEAFIERLELLSEVFVVGFVAAPLFVIVVLIIVTFLGAETVSAIAILVYVGIPLGLVAFVAVIDAVSSPFQERAVSGAPGPQQVSPPSASEDDPDWRQAYLNSNRITGIRERIEWEASKVGDEPWRVLLFSLPIALTLSVVTVVADVIPANLSALVANPVEITTALVVAPLIVATTPVAIVHEYRRRQLRGLETQFPEFLELLATSNRRGLSLTRGLDIVSDSASGRLDQELRRLRNDITWNADLPGAFEAFGDRIASPAVRRTASLIAEGSRATSDLYLVLEVAAQDIAERTRLERERRRDLQSYLVIVIIGFLVYLLVAVLLSVSFLDRIEAATAGVETVGEIAGPISLAEVPVAELRVLLFHSALVQAFGSGVLAGKLAEGTLYSGLKYGIGLVVLTVVVFLVI